MKILTFPKLETERLILDKITTADQNHIYNGLSNPEVIRHYGVSYSSFEETQEQMNWYSNLEKSGTGMWWAIRLKDSGNFCGAIGFNDYQKEHRKGEFGYWLLPAYWKKGYLQESAKKVLDYLFGQLHLHRLEAYVEAENQNSSKTLVNLGFSHEGKMIDCEIKNGEFISIDLFARINRKE